MHTLQLELHLFYSLLMKFIFLYFVSGKYQITFYRETSYTEIWYYKYHKPITILYFIPKVTCTAYINSWSFNNSVKHLLSSCLFINYTLVYLCCVHIYIHIYLRVFKKNGASELKLETFWGK